MQFLTKEHIYYNVYYWDIKAAGPSLLNHLYGINLLYLDKEQRNIRYGELQKEENKLKIIPEILRRYTKNIALRNDAIAYTLDSVITKKNILSDIFVSKSCFTFKEDYHFSIMIIDENYKNYIAITNDNKVIIKGIIKNYLSEKLILQFLTKGIVNFSRFKQWFKITNYKTFLIDNSIIINGKKIDLTNTNIAVDPDREFYWKYLLEFIFIFRQEGTKC